MINSRELISQYLPTKIQNSWIEKLLGFLLAKILKQKDLNSFFQKNEHKKGLDFLESIFNSFKFSYQVSAKHKESIPAEGRAIIVANHPLGALDGLALLHLVLSVRPDVKIIANELLQDLGGLDEYILPINNMQGESSSKRMAAISKALNRNEAVIIFPAGEVSRTRWFKIQDKNWGKGFYLFAKRTNSKIVPVFISGKNSFWFYFSAKFSKLFSMLLLPRQIWRQKNKVITLKIGNPIEYSLLKNLPLKDKEKIKMLRKHIYKLEKDQSLFSVPDAIAHPERRSDLRIELNKQKFLGKNSKGETIALTQAHKNSSILREIGRLRELTFRQVGEGSGTRRDLDKFDSYYQHILIWNDDDLEIAGSYRIMDIKNFCTYANPNAKNPANITKLDFDTSKLYTSTIFAYKGDLNWLYQGLELGRSFVQSRYWNSRSLDNLWQGIGAYCAKNPHIRYLFGAVSISANYPKQAVDYLVAYYGHFYKKGNFNVESYTPYELSQQQKDHYKNVFAGQTLKSAYKDMKEFLREHNLIVPTLFKHYSDICEPEGVYFAGFGIDTSFSDCIDGFVIIDLHHIKPTKHKRYIQPFLEQANEQLEEVDKTSKNSQGVQKESDMQNLKLAKERENAFCIIDF